MKKIFMAIAIVAMVLVVVPQLQAQTRQQQQELEQIARRSINGVSAQDRARTIEIMTDVYVAQGMSRTQAATMAAMAADSMFTTDVGEMTPEQRRQFAEQEQRLADQNQRQLQPQQQQQIQLGENTGWPSTAVLRQVGHQRFNIRQPSGTTASYTDNTIYLSGGNATTVIQDLTRQIERAFNVRVTEYNGSYSASNLYNDRTRGNATVNIRQENGVVIIELGFSAG